MKLNTISLLFLSLLGSLPLFASNPDSTALEREISDEELMQMYQTFLDSVEQTLHFESGVISIGNDLALVTVPPGFKFLNGSDSEMILTDIWGNPPSEEEDRSLGMLIPEVFSPFDDSCYVVNITFSEEGYINDSDAKELDYDDLLKTMKKDVNESNSYREELGYPPVELIGWASQPFYDSANKKLHWAKELKFGDSESNTLNYNIRVLGRRGYLELNVIGEMYHLEQIKREIEPILTSVNFQKGHAYSDFNPSIDKVAAYGIGGLIAGKVLLKAGLLAKFGVILAKLWKVIALAVVGAVAALRKLFQRKSE